MWKRERGDLFRPAECPWHPSYSKEAGGWLVEMGDGWWKVRRPPPLGCQGQYGGEVQGGPCNPCNLLSGLGSSWGTERGGDAAVEDWFEISTPRAGWIGAAILCFGMGASTEGAYGGVLAAGFDMAESPAVIALLRGGQGVGSLDNKVATKDRDSGEVGKGFPILRRDLNHD